MVSATKRRLQGHNRDNDVIVSRASSLNNLPLHRVRREQATSMQYLNNSNVVLVCLRAYAPAGYDDASKNDNDPIYEAECTILGDASASLLRDAMTGSIDNARRPVRELSDQEVGDRARRGAFCSRSSC